MNISKNTHNPIYICDKCNKKIEYGYRQGIKVYKYYSYDPKTYGPKKDFDLCASCEKKFRKWLKEKNTSIYESAIDRFPIYNEGNDKE